MSQRSKLKLLIQSAATTLVAALSLAGTVGATTTIGANISTDGSLTVATTSTLQGAASITSTTNPQLTVKYDTSNYYTEGVSATGVVTFTRLGSALQKGFTLADTVAIASSTLQTLLTIESSSTSNASTTLAVYQFGTGDILNLYDGGTAVFTVKDGGTIGVASSTPWGLLAVEQGTESKSLLVMNSGSSTPSFIINGVNGDGRVGVASSSPYATFSIGQSNATTTPIFAISSASGTGTTTIDLGKVCFKSLTSAGTAVYWHWRVNSGGFDISSSSTSCY